MKLVIVDYGMGNLRSVEKALEKVGMRPVISSAVEDVSSADALVVPGVGAFGDAMKELLRLGLVEPLHRRAKEDVPILGICLGLQIFFSESEEAPGIPGLGLIAGVVKRFPSGRGLKIPHMGWNSLAMKNSPRLLAGVPSGSHVYFVHSYYVAPANEEVIAATCDYGEPFCAAIERGNLFGVQFHPEKSQSVGLQILSNFAQIVLEKQ